MGRLAKVLIGPIIVFGDLKLCLKKNLSLLFMYCISHLTLTSSAESDVLDMSYYE